MRRRELCSLRRYILPFFFVEANRIVKLFDGVFVLPGMSYFRFRNRREIVVEDLVEILAQRFVVDLGGEARDVIVVVLTPTSHCRPSEQSLDE